MIKDTKTENIKEGVDLKSLNDLVKYFKIYERNILINRKNEIKYYVKMGKIIKNINEMYPENWILVLKENEIKYFKTYLIFLIQLYKLFNKYKNLNDTTLSLSFFKRNLTLLSKF